MRTSTEAGTGAMRDSRILLASSTTMDGPALDRIVRESRWGALVGAECPVTTCGTHASALSTLRRRQVAIVVCDAELAPGSWQEMLQHLSNLPDPPLLIVSSRLADERLWAEALNLGAYDVLVQPFDSLEVVRILSLALQHWNERHGVHRRRTRQRMANGRS
jgi:DNA-binding NtrC family response regulator